MHESPQLQKDSRAKAEPFSHESRLLRIHCLISCVKIDGVLVPYVHTVGKAGNITPDPPEQLLNLALKEQE